MDNKPMTKKEHVFRRRILIAVWDTSMYSLGGYLRFHHKPQHEMLIATPMLLSLQ